MKNAKTRRTPLDSSIKLTKEDETQAHIGQELYQSAVGKLLYLFTRTRPDIAYAMSLVAKFTVNPTEKHWKAVSIFSDILLVPSNMDYNIPRVSYQTV